MKKYLLRLFLGILVSAFALTANAVTMQVMGLSEFTTEKPTDYIEFQAFNDVKFSPDLTIHSGYKVKAKVVDVESPKRLKRNAKFSVVPVSYTDFNNQTHPILAQYQGKYSPKFKIDKVELAKNTAISVGNYFVKGLSVAYHAVEGVAKNEEGNRLKSGVVSVYENTPLSLANNGQEIQISKYDFFSFKFKLNKDDEDEDETVE